MMTQKKYNICMRIEVFHDLCNIFHRGKVGKAEDGLLPQSQT